MDFRNQMPTSVVEAANLFTKSIQFYYYIPSYQNQNSDFSEKKKADEECPTVQLIDKCSMAFYQITVPMNHT
jgi:hypothetical protein